MLHSCDGFGFIKQIQENLRAVDVKHFGSGALKTILVFN